MSVERHLKFRIKMKNFLLLKPSIKFIFLNHGITDKPKFFYKVSKNETRYLFF